MTVLVVFLALALGFCLGFVCAVLCYPSKQEIIDRIKRDKS